MSFNWNDITGYSLSDLKQQCKTLNLETKKQPTKRDLIQILKNYQKKMSLDRVKSLPSPQNSQSSSAYNSGRNSPVPSKMTPVSTVKTSLLSSSSHETSTNKKKRIITPVNRNHKNSSTAKNNGTPKYYIFGFVLLLMVILVLGISLYK